MLSLRRSAGTLGAAALLAAGVVAAAPAHAADSVALGVDAPATYYLYAPGTGPGFADLFDDIDLHANPLDGDPEPMVHGVTVTLDLSSLAGKVSLSEIDDTCDVKSLVATCDVGTVEGEWTMQPFDIQATDSAKAGESGKVTIHATSSDGGTVDRTMTFVIGNPQLSANKLPDQSGVKPGGSFDIPIAIGDRGDVPADHGFGVIVDGGNSLDLAHKYSNCHYRPASAEFGEPSAYCEFDQTIKPGEAYQLSAPITATADDSLMYSDVSYWAWPLDAKAPYGFDKSEYTATGTGDPVALKPATGVGYTENGFGSVSVSADNHADFQAVGATVKGKVGDTATIVVSAKNLGPGTMDLSSRDASIYSLEFTPPAGTTVVGNPYPGEEDPWTCDPGKAGAATYTCDPMSETMAAGDHDDFVFLVRIDKKVAGATGQVKVITDQGDYPAHDDNAANDTADIPVTVTS